MKNLPIEDSLENPRFFAHIQRQLQESALLSQASAIINSTLHIQEIMQLLLTQTNELLQAECLAIAALDEQRQELVYEIAVGAGSQELSGRRQPADEGAAGWALQHRLPTRLPDQDKDAAAIICAPLQAKGKLLGIIQATDPAAGRFSEEDLQLLIKLANLVSSALLNGQQLAQAQAAEARYLSLFEDNIDSIILTDTEGTILEANRMATQLLRYSRAALTGMHISLLHPPQTHFVTLAGIQATPPQVQLHIDQAITQDNAAIPVEVYVKRLKTGDDELLQWIHHDISKQVELEEMREELMAMLIHDLQSPLSNIISSLELINQEIDPRTHPLAITILDIARRSSRRLRTLISSLLDISRLEAGQPVSDRTTASPARLIAAAQEVVAPILQQRRTHLILNLQPDLPDVDVDADMIARVLINLLDNALRLARAGQSLTITATHDKTNANHVLISVADQGPGIPPIYRQAVFDKFYRIPDKNGGKSIGLGLAFCRLAVEAHGGRIWVDQAPGGGALFSFTLPLAANSTAGSKTYE